MSVEEVSAVSLNKHKKHHNKHHHAMLQTQKDEEKADAAAAEEAPKESKGTKEKPTAAVQAADADVKAA
jgi:hypothetical protein